MLRYIEKKLEKSSMKQELEKLHSKNTLNYVTCFSEQKDLLSMWRGYGDNGKGIAIGFSNDWLKQFNNQSTRDFNLLNVRYGEVRYESKQKDMIVSGIIRKLNSWSNQNNWRDFLTAEIGIVSMLCKNEGFREEMEWRLMLALTDESEYKKSVMNWVNFVCTAKIRYQEFSCPRFKQIASMIKLFHILL